MGLDHRGDRRLVGRRGGAAALHDDGGDGGDAEEEDRAGGGRRRVRRLLREGGDLDADARVKFDEQKRLALYYVAQLDLFAEMCLDRSYNSIGTLEQHFPYEMLVSLMVNEKLPDQIRASMTLLLMRLFVDRFPHENLRAPNPVQVLSEIKLRNLDDASALPQFTVDPKGPLSLQEDKFFNFGVAEAEHASNKFHLIEDFISDYLLALGGCQVAKDKEKNIFTLAILTILQNLVNFGFYGSRAEIVDLCNPMIATLDGRADKITKTSPEGDEARKQFDDYTSLVMDSKRQMINSLYGVCKLRDDFRLSIIMYEFRQSTNGKPLLEQDKVKADKWILIDKFQDAFNNVFEAGGDIDGTALDLELTGTADGTILGADLSAQLFATVENLFAADWVLEVATLCVVLLITYLVTSADSAVLVINTIVSGGATDGIRPRHIVLWSVLLGLVIITLLFAGGMDALRSVMIIGALPFSAVMLFMLCALVYALWQDSRSVN